MKKIILSIITVLTIVIGLTNLTNAATLNGGAVTTLAGITNINKIEVRGNVQLYISDAASDQVKVYNKYYSESALVQNKNGVLNIASYSPEKLVVWVSAADLRSVSAYDNAEVRTFGDFSKIEFSVDLHDNASANINIDAFNANVTVNDHAKADLSGTANKLSLSHNYAASVNNFNFEAVHFAESKTNFPAETSEDVVGI